MTDEREGRRTSEPYRRDWRFSTLAVLLSASAAWNFTMAIQNAFLPRTQGAMLFGICFHSILVNAIVGPLLGSLQGAYAYGIWKRKRWLPKLAMGYALYMPINFLMFWFLHPEIAMDRFFLWPAWHAVQLTGFVGGGLYVAYHRNLFQ